MALTIGINTFTTLDEADAYFADRLYSEDWENADTEDRERALRMAARVMNRLPWHGSLTSDSQVMAWPRQGIVDRERRAVAVTTTPQDIKDAQCELALAFIREDLTGDDSNRGVKRIKAGSVEMEYNGQAPDKALPDVVLELLNHYLRPAPSGAAPLRF